MKTMILSLLIASSTAIAGEPSFVARSSEPNSFRCVEKSNPSFMVNYTTSSRRGEPTMNVGDGSDSLVPGKPGENLVNLSSVNSPIGTVVSSLVTRKHIADAPSAVYSLVVPGIMLRNMGDNVKFETILMIGSNGGFRSLPAVYQQIHDVKQMECEAQLVNF